MTIRQSSFYEDELIRMIRCADSFYSQHKTALLRVESKDGKAATIELHSEECIDSLIRVLERCRASLRNGGMPTS